MLSVGCTAAMTCMSRMTLGRSSHRLTPTALTVCCLLGTTRPLSVLWRGCGWPFALLPLAVLRLSRSCVRSSLPVACLATRLGAWLADTRRPIPQDKRFCRSWRRERVGERSASLVRCRSFGRVKPDGRRGGRQAAPAAGGRRRRPRFIPRTLQNMSTGFVDWLALSFLLLGGLVFFFRIRSYLRKSH